MHLPWTFPSWGPNKPCIKINLNITLPHHENKRTAPHSMKWSYNLSLVKKKKKRQYYRLAWLCAKRCFGSVGGHTASTNINASAAFSWQKKEPTKPDSSKLIQAVLFLERQICVSTDTASHITPTQGNTLRRIQFLFILLEDPQNTKGLLSWGIKAWGGTHLKMGSPGLSSDGTAHLKRPHTGQKHTASVMLWWGITNFLGSEGLGAPQVPASLPKVCFAIPPGVKTRLGTTTFFCL